MNSRNALRAVVAMSAACLPATFCWSGEPAATYEAWQRHRDAVRRDGSLIRYYTFGDLKAGVLTTPNLAADAAPLSFVAMGKPGGGKGTLTVVPGRWPEKKAVRLDAGAMAAPPFPIPDKTFTVECWFRKNGPGVLRGNNGSTSGTILSVGIGFWDGWRLWTPYPAKTIRYEIGRPRPTNAVGVTTAPVPDGVWLHLAATWDGHDMRVYVNGLLAATRECSGDYTPPAKTAQFRVGYAGHGIGSVKLDMDEVAVYKRALGPLEVLRRAYFHAPLAEEASIAFRDAFSAHAVGNRGAAAAAFQQVLAVKGVHRDYRTIARLALGRVAGEQDDARSAIRHFADVLNDLGAAEAHRRTALTEFLTLSRHASGAGVPRAVYERVLAMPDVSPADKIGTRFSLAGSYLMEGKPAAARDQYAEIFAIEEATPGDRRQAQIRIAHSYWAQKQYAAAREAYGKLVADGDAPPHSKTIAQLRIAETFVKEKNYAAAAGALKRVSGVPDAPSSHRWEADQRLRQIGRMQAGLPPRDPSRSRTQLPKLPRPAVELYVAPDGADTDPGTKARPFATLERARDKVRELRVGGSLSKGGATVYLRGDHGRKKTFRLSAEDSGTAQAPIVYRSVPGETAILSGGVRLSGFVPVKDPAVLSRLPGKSRGKVLGLDLKAKGITDFGTLVPRGFGRSGSPWVDVYCNGKPMQLARWPNDRFVVAGKVIASGKRGSKDAAVFDYDGDRPERWTSAPDAWLFGYWYHHWADGRVGIASIDVEHKRITTAGPPSVYGMRAGQHYYAFNLLEELDIPGEWYMDRGTGALYLYPPAPIEGATVYLPMLDGPMVQLDEVSHVTLRGLVFEHGRSDGVVISGGEHNLLAGCTVRRLGGIGVKIDGGTDHVVLGCDIHTLGRHGTWVRGGDRKTLAPGRHVIENCHIHDFSRIDRTYTPAVWMDGVGNRIAHNLMHDSPHHAMRIEGNDHVIEFNEIHSVVSESDDQGGLDIFFNPTYRGIIIRHNFWHHIGSPLVRHGQAGIRLDDAISGVLIYGNVFYRCSGNLFGAVQIHGGKENVLDNNLFVDCRHAVSFSGWGEKRWKAFLASPRVVDAMTKTVDVRKPPYSTRYPDLARIEEGPDVNLLWRNVVVWCGRFMTRDRGKQVLFDNVVMGEDPGFVDVEARNFQLRDDSPVYRRSAFRPLPFDQIGLYNDERRASWPVRHTVSDRYRATPETTPQGIP